MTERPHETDIPEFDLGPPAAPYPDFHEWLAQHPQYDTDNQGAEKPASEPARAASATSPQTRVFGSTLPYGFFLLVTAFIAAHTSTYQSDPTRQLIGLALITWATSLGCELTASYFLGTDYPAWGMWAWITHPTTRRIFASMRQRTGRVTNNGVFFAVAAGLLLPGFFLGTWAMLTALSIARQLWMISAVTGSVIHIAVTAYRSHTWWSHRDHI
jgi:hypothetical protein